MNQPIQKLKTYLEENLHKTEHEILATWGASAQNFDGETLIYMKPRGFLLSDEVVFFLKNGKVTDITITEYFLWFALHNIFYCKHSEPVFKVVRIGFLSKFFCKSS